MKNHGIIIMPEIVFMLLCTTIQIGCAVTAAVHWEH